MKENSDLASEYESLSVTVKTQVGSLANVGRTFTENETKHEEALRLVTEVRDVANKELEETKGVLATLEDEYINLFEEGYTEYLKRLEVRGTDINGNRFEVFLREL